MMARGHIISGVATFVTLTGAATLVSRASWYELPLSAVVFAVKGISDYFLVGNEPFSLFTIVGAFLYLLGCLLPDADSSKSFVGKKVHVPIRHRTWLHSIWPVLLLALVSWWVRPFAWLALGYFVHLFWDSLSRMGVCWFYPVPGYLEYESGARIKKGHWLWLYRANSTAETVVTVLSCVPAVIVFVFVALSGVIRLGI